MKECEQLVPQLPDAVEFVSGSLLDRKIFHRRGCPKRRRGEGCYRFENIPCVYLLSGPGSSLAEMSRKLAGRFHLRSSEALLDILANSHWFRNEQNERPNEASARLRRNRSPIAPQIGLGAEAAGVTDLFAVIGGGDFDRATHLIEARADALADALGEGVLGGRRAQTCDARVRS
jgi:hypothetical protein